MGKNRPPIILLADDDEDDRNLIKDACDEAGLTCALKFVEDGEKLLAFLRGEGAFADEECAPFRGIVLLDLNMPGMDGRQALREMKADPALKPIPVVVLTSSGSQEDVARTYEEGGSSFIIKPSTFEGLVELVAALDHYWLEVVSIPHGEHGPV